MLKAYYGNGVPKIELKIWKYKLYLINLLFYCTSVNGQLTVVDYM
jgi:hypothetical protein